MTVEQKIIRNKVGLLELAKELGMSARPARYLVIPAIAFTALKIPA